MLKGDSAIWRDMVVTLDRVGTFTAQFRHPVTSRMTTVKVESLRPVEPEPDPHSDCTSCERCGRCSCETSTDVYLDSTIGYDRFCPECRAQELQDRVEPEPGNSCNRETGLCDGSCPDARDYHDGANCDGSCPGAVEYGRCHCGCCPAPGREAKPARCQFCGNPAVENTDLCTDCLATWRKQLTPAQPAPVRYCEVCLASPGNCVCPPAPEYVETRRGTIAIAELPARGPIAPGFYWSVGWAQGIEPTRAYAITAAYTTFVRSNTPMVGGY